MRQIYTLEIAALVKELKNLVDYRIDKFYEIDRGRFRIRVSSRTGKADLLFILGQTVNATTYIEGADFPTSFSQGIRKRITNAVIQDVVQLNDDRIIEFVLSKDGKRINLILEMFAKCNLITTGDNGVIDMAYFRHRFRDRTIRSGETYKTPENSAVHLSNLSNAKDIIREGVKSMEKHGSAIKVLANMTNLGSMYIEDVLNKLDIDPKMPMSDVDKQTWDRISDGISGLGSIVDEPKPRVYTRDGKAVDYSLIDIKKYSDLETTGFDTVQEMLDHFYHSAQEVRQTKENPASKELEISIGKQKEALEMMVEGIKTNHDIGEAIFRNMYMINQIIDAARSDRHITKENLSKMFPGITIYSVDLKDKTIEIEL